MPAPAALVADDSVSRPDNVWHGDIARIGFSRFIATQRWLFPLGALCLVVPLVYNPWPVLGVGFVWIFAGTAAAVAIGVAGALELARHLGLPTRVSDGQESSGAEEPVVVASRLWARALIGSGRRLRFDVGTYLDAVGPAGPRVLAISELPPALPIPGDVFEEVDMGVDRPTSPARRKRLWMSLIAFGVLAAIQAALGRLSPSPAWWLNMLFPGGMLAVAIVQLRLIPVRLGGASASIGEFGDRPWLGLLPPALVPPRRFTRVDSVLLLHELIQYPGGTALRVAFLRRDGATKWIGFAEGWKDPAFQQLLARWTYRAAPLARAGTTA
ncbi:MAG: hypothetical protein K2Q20_10685 [Phycisphaerales bacterium]|nr:hypothetical protein [Phycisphaerales bacterium]